MKKRRVLSLLMSLIMSAALVSCAMPETSRSNRSSPEPEQKVMAETVSEEASQLVINEKYNSTDDAVRIFWNEIEDASFYRIERKEKDDWKRIDTISSTKTEYRADNLKAETEYEFRVVPEFGFLGGKDGTPSESITVKTKAKATTTTKKSTESSKTWNDDYEYDYNYTTTAKKTYTPPVTTQQPSYGGVYYYSETGECYHIDLSCPAVRNMNNVMKSDSIPSGKRACSKCCLPY